ncbi:MAG: hypothetical protein Q8K98_12305 [Bacteroidota bacterium]|nr:hypothetical protein [Bacteroidota bacterium]
MSQEINSGTSQPESNNVTGAKNDDTVNKSDSIGISIQGQYAKNTNSQTKHNAHDTKYNMLKSIWSSKNIPLQDQPHWWIVRLTIIICITALLGNIITFWQSCSNWDAVKIENRAYIGIQEIIPKPVVVGKPVEITFIAANVGKTPAYSVRQQSGLSFWSEFTVDDPFKHSDIIFPKDTQAVYVLGSGAPLYIEHSSNTTLKKSELDTLQKGAFTIYAYTSITYNDIFGVPHFTHICLEYMPAVNMWRAAKKYNDAN